MNVLTLANAVPERLLVEVVGDTNRSVVDVTHDSRLIQTGWAFACISGENHDGRRFAGDAVKAGASALIVDRALPSSEVGAIGQVVVTDVRRAVGAIASQAHGTPSRAMTMVGVTGTNGKTTTTHLLGSILGNAGRSTRELGTLTGVRTTPEATDLQRTLAGFVASGVDATVMEVSSHALALNRVDGTHFDVAIFTNLGRDHIDLHKSVEAYFRAKASLFEPTMCDVGVTNIDDAHGRLLFDAASIEMIGFSISDAADLVVGVDRLRFVWRGTHVSVPLGARFNVMNVLAALTAADVLGIDAEVAAHGLAQCTPVPGRFEVVTDTDRHPFVAIVDYAHTPEGLVEVLTSARELVRDDGRLIVVFGCGGGRDRDKRPLMGAAASSLADMVVVTSDNPRDEDPKQIIDAIIDGIALVGGPQLIRESDRRVAIASAIATAQAGDVVVIAGKGHESTQTIGNTAVPFDDRAVVREVLAGVASGSSDHEHRRGRPEDRDEMGTL